MNDLEDRLAAAFAGDAPPAADVLFRIAVLERYERRAFRLRMTLVVLAGLTASVLLWLAAPSVAREAGALHLSANAMTLVGLALAVIPAAWGVQRAFKVI